MGRATKTIPALRQNRPADPLDMGMNDRFRAALLNAGEVMYEWNIADHELYLLSELGHARKEQLHGMIPAWDSGALSALIHPDDKRRFLLHLRAALKGESEDCPELFHRVEIRLRGKPGTWHWIAISGRVTQRNTDHRALRMTGTFLDVGWDRQQCRQAAYRYEPTLGRTLGCIPKANNVASQSLDMCWDQENVILEDQVPACAVPINHPLHTLTARESEAFGSKTPTWHTNSSIRYRQLIESSPEAIIVCTGYQLSFLNRAACRLFGVQTPSRLLGRDILEFVDPEYRDELHDHFNAVFRDKAGTCITEQQWRRIDQSSFDVEISASFMEFSERSSVQLVIRDVSERKRSEAFRSGQFNVLNLVATGAALTEILTELCHVIERQIDGAHCAIWYLNAQGKVVSHADSSPISSKSSAELSPIEARSVAAWKQTPTHVEASCMSNAALEAAPLPAIPHHAASRHELNLTALLPITNREEKAIGAIAVYHRGMTKLEPSQKQTLEACAGLACVAIESRTVNEHIRYLAHYDGLTSLPNRFLFKEYLDQALADARKRRHKFAVLFLDLDKFKEVNDKFGHNAGDEVLQKIAARMRACLRHTDKIARMGGDEFYVLIEALHDSRYAADIAQKLLEAASRPVEAAGQTHQLSVSIGISIYPDDGNTAQSLLQNADAAMYRAKEMGKDRFAFFSTANPKGNRSQIRLRSCVDSPHVF